jgi:hypothetical protein
MPRQKLPEGERLARVQARNDVARERIRARRANLPLSIAGGVDFGNYKHLGLEKPNLHEQLIIARVRLYQVTVKVKRTKSSSEVSRACYEIPYDLI